MLLGALFIKQKKGQLTLETLLVCAVALSLLIIAASAVNEMQNSQEGILQKKSLKDGVDMIADYADEICILGEGNSRTVEIAYTKFGISTDNRKIIATDGRWNYSRDVLCNPKVIANSKFEKIAYLWYEDGDVKISPNPKN
ncbi:MAG: hypothetical protein WC492_00800 [Candidatus Micrarchaeia archaeon]